MLLLFGKRLIPATKVSTAPVITIRQEADTNLPSNTQVTKGSMLFQASGWLEPDPYTTFVSTLVDGIVDEVYVLGGESVKKGDFLATLIDDDAELVAASKKVDAFQTALMEAENNYQRLKKAPSGAVSQQQVISAKFAQRQKAALVGEAEAQISRIKARSAQIELERIAMTKRLQELETVSDRAKLALDRTRIVSPMDGIILHLHAAPGKKRLLNMDDPKSAVIVELYDPNKIQARIDVPLSEAAGMQIGQLIELSSDLLPNTILNGIVTRISGEADMQRNTLQAKVSVQNPDTRLRPGMLVRAKFFSTGKSSLSQSESSSQGRLALYVPESALIDEQTVWVVDTQQKADLRTIKLTSESKDSHRRVVEGLRSGEQVILPPHKNLKPGTRLQFPK